MAEAAPRDRCERARQDEDLPATTTDAAPAACVMALSRCTANHARRRTSVARHSDRPGPQQAARLVRAGRRWHRASSLRVGSSLVESIGVAWFATTQRIIEGPPLPGPFTRLPSLSPRRCPSGLLDRLLVLGRDVAALAYAVDPAPSTPDIARVPVRSARAEQPVDAPALRSNRPVPGVERNDGGGRPPLLELVSSSPSICSLIVEIFSFRRATRSGRTTAGSRSARSSSAR